MPIYYLTERSYLWNEEKKTKGARPSSRTNTNWVIYTFEVMSLLLKFVFLLCICTHTITQWMRFMIESVFLDIINAHTRTVAHSEYCILYWLFIFPTRTFSTWTHEKDEKKKQFGQIHVDGLISQWLSIHSISMQCDSSLTLNFFSIDSFKNRIPTHFYSILLTSNSIS